MEGVDEQALELNLIKYPGGHENCLIKTLRGLDTVSVMRHNLREYVTHEHRRLPASVAFVLVTRSAPRSYSSFRIKSLECMFLKKSSQLDLCSSLNNCNHRWKFYELLTWLSTGRWES